MTEIEPIGTAQGDPKPGDVWADREKMKIKGRPIELARVHVTDVTPTSVRVKNHIGETILIASDRFREAYVRVLKGRGE